MFFLQEYKGGDGLDLLWCSLGDVTVMGFLILFHIHVWGGVKQEEASRGHFERLLLVRPTSAAVVQSGVEHRGLRPFAEMLGENQRESQTQIQLTCYRCPCSMICPSPSPPYPILTKQVMCFSRLNSFI